METNTTYTMTAMIKTNDGGRETLGEIVLRNSSCDVTKVASVRCIGPTGTAELTKRVNRSHVAIEWYWHQKYKDFYFTMEKVKILNIACTYESIHFIQSLNGVIIMSNRAKVFVVYCCREHLFLKLFIYCYLKLTQSLRFL